MQKKLKKATSNFKNFLTNQGENTLENKLHKILEKQHIKYIDFLIGYFRITGFNKIAKYLHNIDEARVLVGINIDRATFDANSKAKNIDILATEQAQVFNDEISEEKYNSVELLVALLSQKDKLKIRVAPNNDIHAKLYILRDTKEPYEDSVGSVIIGSSNLTYNGLKGNFELNTQLNHPTQIDEATKIFNVLWEYSEELTLKDVEDKIIPKFKNYPQKKSDELTPYKLYLKLLIEHFGSRIDFIDDEDIFVPKAYKKLSYQIEAVNDGIAKLGEHGGFFLSDVVGLGKTVVVAMLIKKLESQFRKKVLVVIPPAVRIQWEDTFSEFSITYCDVVSLASLSKVDASKYELIVVDESHKFKNSESKRYKQLYEICLDKKIILLSATPQNNTPSDLYNQIALFQNVKNSTLSKCRNLQSFFAKQEKEYKEIIQKKPIDEIALKILSEKIRDDVLRTVMIRRTRYDIQHHDMYKVDIEAEGLSIPKVNEPVEHEYKLEGKLGIVFDETAIKIIQKLNYSRFNSFFYLTKEAQVKYYPHESANIFDKNPLAGLMKTLLIKRFESSFSAFKISIDRHKKRYEKFIENFEKDIIYLGEKATDILDYDDEETNGDYEDFIQKLIESARVKQLQKSDFKKEFEADLRLDYEIFKELVATWKDIDEDPKLKKFKEVISKDRENKVVIFTESVDTLNYLKEKLPNSEKILFITSQNRDDKKDIIQKNFDANYEKSKQKDDYDIIITTDTLAEGINLHRSNIVYNYDIPWNATKLIQRIGRVNRIGTRAYFIYIHNFKPASHIENLISLSQKAFVKLQSSHTMMGEDNQIYSIKESVSSVTLFDEYKKEAKEKDEELEYLEEIREFREENENEFNRIAKLQKELILTRKGRVGSAYIVLDINKHKNYVYIDENIIKPITFVEIAKALKVNIDEVALKNNKDKNKEYISKVITYFEDEFRKKKQDKAENKVDVKNDKKALNFLNEWFIDEYIDQKCIDRCEELIKGGESILLSKQIVALKDINREKINEKLKDIISTLVVNRDKEVAKDKIKVILSEAFSKE